MSETNMGKLKRDIYSMVEEYDYLLSKSQKKWEQLQQLKPERMDKFEFADLIVDARENLKLIRFFKEDEPQICKTLISAGASKKFLYNYVSQLDESKLSDIQKKLLEDLHNVKREKNYPSVFDREICDSRIITKKEYNRLLDKMQNKEEFTFDEKDNFLMEDTNVYITIDNTNGEMLVEEFSKKELAERYLHGEDLEELKKKEEFTYKIRIYETENDYHKGEAFEILETFSDSKEAIKELESRIKFSNYYAGTVISRETDREICSRYSLQNDENKIKYIMKCDLKACDDGEVFKNRYLLVCNPNELEPELEIILNGDLCYSCEFDIMDPKLVGTVNSVNEILEFCKQHGITLSRERITENGLIAGGEGDILINNNLEVMEWNENLEYEGEEEL